MESLALASMEGLWYWYPEWSERRPRGGPGVPGGPGGPALAGVDLEISPGLTVLAGDSAAGKSTLLRVLNGLVPHFHGGRFAGRARTAGLDVVTTPTRDLARRVGFVFDRPDVGFVRSKVAQEVAFTGENLGLPPQDLRDGVDNALARLGIAHLAGRRLATLSGGERQRVALAGALAFAPAVLALDEPTSQLDASGGAALAAILGELAEEGRAVVVSEHRTAWFPSARVVYLDGGRISPGAAAGSAAGAGPAGGPGSAAEAPRAGAPGAPTGRGELGEEAWSLAGVAAGPAGAPVLEGVDLCGRAGEAVVLWGANGSGKTTLLRTIAGSLAPLSGRAWHRPGRVAYLPQDPATLLHRATVRAEVEQTLRWSGDPTPPDEVLSLLGLQAVADRDPRDLSGGQRQRAAIAAVVAGRPRTVLLDEPTRGMDAHARASLHAALATLAHQGASVVMATHDETLAFELADRVVRVADGAVAEVAQAHTSPAAY